MKMLLPVLLMLATGKTILPGEVKVKTLPPESREVLDYLPRNIVIAHRGTTYWAPEETEAAMRWARNIGADYLELDLQRTKDGVLIALHDVNLRRTTNVETVFPDRVFSKRLWYKNNEKFLHSFPRGLALLSCSAFRYRGRGVKVSL